MTDNGDGRRDFLDAHAHGFFGVAFVVLNDAAAARDVTEALVDRIYRQWSPLSHDGRPLATSRRWLGELLVAGASRVSRSPSAAEVKADREPAPNPDHFLEPDSLPYTVDQTLAAYDEWPPLERTGAAYRHFFRPTDDELLAALPTLDLGSLQQRLTEVPDLERALDARSSVTPTSVDPVVGAQRRATRRRRRRTFAALASALLLAGGAGLAATRHQSPAARPAPTPATTTPQVRNAWPARGTLRTDPRMLRALEKVEQATSTKYAGDLGPLRILVAGRSGQNTDVVLVTSAGGDPATLAHAADVVDVNGSVFSTALTYRGRWYFFVLAQPGINRAAVSFSADVAQDGSYRRRWTDVRLVDGVALIPMAQPLSPLQPALAAVDGQPIAYSGFPLRDTSFFTTCSSCTEQELRESDTSNLLHDVAALTQTAPTQSQATTVHSVTLAPTQLGELFDSTFDPSIDPKAPTRLVMSDVQTPGGGLVRGLTIVKDDATLASERAPLPVSEGSGAPGLFLLPGKDASNTMGIFAPGAVSAQMLDGTGAPVGARIPLTTGVGKVSAPDGQALDFNSVAVETRRADGTVIYRGKAWGFGSSEDPTASSGNPVQLKDLVGPAR